MSSATPIRATVTTVVLAVALVMTGCAAQQPDYGSEIADKLQAEVLEVSKLSADADFAGAMLALTELEAELKDARARGTLTEARYESILAATALVRADLQSAIDALAPPPPTPEPTIDEDDGGDDNTGNEGNDKGKDGKDGKGKNGKDKKEDKDD